MRAELVADDDPKLAALAAKPIDPGAVAQAFEAPADLLRFSATRGTSPLSLAFASKSLQAVEHLFSFAPNEFCVLLGYTDAKGNTPLGYLLEHGSGPRRACSILTTLQKFDRI